MTVNLNLIGTFPAYDNVKSPDRPSVGKIKHAFMRFIDGQIYNIATAKENNFIDEEQARKELKLLINSLDDPNTLFIYYRSSTDSEGLIDVVIPYNASFNHSGLGTICEKFINDKTPNKIKLDNQEIRRLIQASELKVTLGRFRSEIINDDFKATATDFQQRLRAALGRFGFDSK